MLLLRAANIQLKDENKNDQVRLSIPSHRQDYGRWYERKNKKAPVNQTGALIKNQAAQKTNSSGKRAASLLL